MSHSPGARSPGARSAGAGEILRLVSGWIAPSEAGAPRGPEAPCWFLMSTVGFASALYCRASTSEARGLSMAHSRSNSWGVIMTEAESFQRDDRPVVTEARGLSCAVNSFLRSGLAGFRGLWKLKPGGLAAP